jgi:hypothetical protein
MKEEEFIPPSKGIPPGTYWEKWNKEFDKPFPIDGPKFTPPIIMNPPELPRSVYRIRFRFSNSVVGCVDVAVVAASVMEALLMVPTGENDEVECIERIAPYLAPKNP